MDRYIDVTVLPDPEMAETILMNNLFAKLHRALVDLGSTGIGVSFPSFAKTLGATLRLHGTSESLERLMSVSWLKGLRDYCKVGDISNVPDGVKFRIVRRVQAKSAHNKRKRSIAKGWISEEQAAQKIPNGQERKLKLPFVQLNSGSTGQMMRVYIEHKEVLEQPREGLFNTYGLSAQATVPWF